jgi:hypothetical protein
MNEVITNRAPTTALLALAALDAVIAVVELTRLAFFPPVPTSLACCPHVLP